jgi:hypothetical protein
MQVILYSNSTNEILLALPGDDIQDFLDKIPGPYLIRDSEDLPTAPRVAWIVDWEAGTISAPAHTPSVSTNWPALVAAIQSDEDFNAVWASANAIKPMLAASLLVAFGNVATGGLATFAALYEAVCALGGATAEQRVAWAALAEQHHAPPEFVAIVRG